MSQSLLLPSATLTFSQTDASINQQEEHDVDETSADSRSDEGPNERICGFESIRRQNVSLSLQRRTFFPVDVFSCQNKKLAVDKTRGPTVNARVATLKVHVVD